MRDASPHEAKSVGRADGLGLRGPISTLFLEQSMDDEGERGFQRVV